MDQLNAKPSHEIGLPHRRRHVPIFILAASSLVLLLVGVWTFWQARQVAKGPAASAEQHAGSWPRSPWKNARPGVKYVGDAACARCHGDIADTFRRHPMGRSLAPIASAPAVGLDRAEGRATFEAGRSQFTVLRHAGKEVHREARLDENGQVLAQVEAEVKYALGSGTRGISYLVEHDGRLFQSPIAWYSQKKKWDLSPGYEKNNSHFDRPIEPSCLFCHTNRVEPVQYSVNRYEQPVFRGHAIGCERCHGPGELHTRRQEVVDGRDMTIVNPRHLEPALRSAVCEQCHLLGDHRVDRLDREPFDFHPGLSLTAFFAVYGRAEERENNAVGQVEQMKLSRCFRESQGRLSCISCHDPHQAPPPREKTAYFRQQCLECHDRTGCKLSQPVRLAKSREDNCIECHMQRSDSVDIMHTATTDHRILRMPHARTTERDRKVSGPEIVLLNGDNLGQDKPDGLARELAIALALEGPRLADSPAVREMGSLVLTLLDRALAKRPDDLFARRMKAQVLALSGRRTEALRVVESALRLAPSDERALDQCLAYAIDGGNIQAALEPARRAVALNPWSPAFRERLAYVSIQHQHWDDALYQAREALRLDPFLRFARMFVIECHLHEKDKKRAEEEFATLIKLNPSQRESLSQWFAQQQRN